MFIKRSLLCYRYFAYFTSQRDGIRDSLGNKNESFSKIFFNKKANIVYIIQKNKLNFGKYFERILLTFYLNQL